MKKSSRFAGALFVVCLLVLASTAAAASATPQTTTAAHHVRSVHVTFHHVRSDVNSLLTDGRYVFLQTVLGGTFNGGVLIDDATGQQTASPAGCLGPVLGGPWLLFTAAVGAGPTEAPNCIGTLYPVTGGATQSINTGLGAQPVAIGTNWVELDTNCDDVHVCPSWSFQNLQTGATEPDPTNSSSIPDLNAPALAHRICSPLRVPADSGAAPTALLRQAGKFVLAATPKDQFLRKCGTHLNQRLGAGTDPVALTSKVVLWQEGQRTLDGLLLPSLQPLRIRLPMATSFEVAVGPRTLYAVGDDQLWTAPVPRPFAGATTNGCLTPSCSPS
jgi:hypothetical protein